jgi:hypothetical protein
MGRNKQSKRGFIQKTETRQLRKEIRRMLKNAGAPPAIIRRMTRCTKHHKRKVKAH